MATIVGLRRETRTIAAVDHHVIEIVDGQQRITTLILLFKAIVQSLDLADHETTIGQVVNDLLVKDDQATLLLLQTNHDNSDYFANYLRKGTRPPSATAETVADRELLSAMEDCERFVSAWSDDGNSLEALVTLLNNRLTFVLHEVSDESLVYSVFEVLNSRGLQVSWFDRLKSMLMAIVFETDSGNSSEIISEVHQLWAEIYRRIGLRSDLSTEALRFAATLRSPARLSSPLNEEDAARTLHGQSTNGPEYVIETTQWLKNVIVTVDHLATDRRIAAVTRFAQARIVATAVYLRPDFSKSERRRILHRWENITFRIYGMFRKDARWATGSYVRLAWSIINKQLSSDEVLKSLTDIGMEFPVADAVDNMRKTDCYTYWGEELRYFLHRYEEHLSEKHGQKFKNEQWNRIWESSAASSIEHIRPQDWWTKKGRESEVNQMHRLGNLMMLPPRLNSELQDKPPSQKAKAYTKTGLLTAQKVADAISDSGKWTFAGMKERENRILEWARQEWAD